jgi:hypothetical protein
MRPWFTMRFNWQKRFRDDLFKAVDDGHTLTPLLGIVARYIEAFHGVDHLDARDVFFFAFLRYQPGFEDAKLPGAAESLQRMADRGPNEAP